ncbi:hypothetical protein Uis1B_1703 [Bifidobacterium margollesii]|uniref:Uncharacterized protein n=1 Tax=Bifidobacterium margollesii TaxID=2020964 RepID=A0A2N5J8L4_9BIFI|nr:hypothetical protein [Bifidobacterium margollesii]PLS30558.1 hypothetical protein Uis1B_1703 [Bifidobacterium margollesii]
MAPMTESERTSGGEAGEDNDDRIDVGSALAELDGKSYEEQIDAYRGILKRLRKELDRLD